MWPNHGESRPTKLNLHKLYQICLKKEERRTSFYTDGSRKDDLINDNLSCIIENSGKQDSGSLWPSSTLLNLRSLSCWNLLD